MNYIHKEIYFPSSDGKNKIHAELFIPSDNNIILVLNCIIRYEDSAF